MQIKLKNILYLVFILPLLIIWSSNAYTLDISGERTFVYWNLSYISLFSSFIYFMLSFNNLNKFEFKLFYSYFKYIIAFFLISFVATFFSSFIDELTLVRIFQLFILAISSGLSLFMGIGLTSNGRNIKILNACVIIVIILTVLFFIFNSFKESFIIILSKRPYTLSFYFIPILAFYLIYFNKHKGINFLLIPFLLIIAFLSGSRSALIMLFPLIYYFYRDYSKIIIVIFILYINFFVNLINLDKELIDNIRVVNIENSREFIWEKTISLIYTEGRYLIGNGMVLPNLSNLIDIVNSPHNTYLFLFYTYGIIGFIIGLKYIFKIIQLIWHFNKYFAISFILITWVNDLSIFPFFYSRIFEFMFIYFFIGTLISLRWKQKK